MLWKTFRKHYGLDGASEILVAKAASRTMNPSLSARVVERAFEEDAAAAMAEYGADFKMTFGACLTSRLSRLRLIAVVSSDLVCLGCATLRLLTLRAFWRRRQHDDGYCACREGCRGAGSGP